MPADEVTCPECGAALAPGGSFCEACGHRLPWSETSSPGAARTAVASSLAPPSACGKCTGTEFDAGGYCVACGARRPCGADHCELDLGEVAGVSDIGSRHHHNEDGMAVAVGDGFIVAVVCDGVSSSNRPDTASHSAADAAVRVLADQLARTVHPPRPPAHTGADEVVTEPNAPEPAGAGEEPDTHPLSVSDARTTPLRPTPSVRAVTAAIGAAGDAAQAAATLAAVPAGRDTLPNPPCTTFVTAVVTDRSLTVGWVGDSRAYWLPDPGTPDPPACLTIDDTLAGQLAAAGVPVSLDLPNAGALMRWLGADAVDTRPHTATLTPSGPGRVVVCSDGLYRYLPDAEDLAAATPEGTAYEVAATMVAFALRNGGHDNVSVVVMPYPAKP